MTKDEDTTKITLGVGGIITIVLCIITLILQILKIVLKKYNNNHIIDMTFLTFANITMVWFLFIGIIYFVAVIVFFIFGSIYYRKKQKLVVYKGDKTHNVTLEGSFGNTKEIFRKTIRKLLDFDIYGVTRNSAFGIDDMGEELKYHVNKQTKLMSNFKMRLYSKQPFKIEFESEKLAREHGFKSKLVTSKPTKVIINSKKEEKQFHIIEPTIRPEMVSMGLFPQGNGWFLFPRDFYLKNK